MMFLILLQPLHVGYFRPCLLYTSGRYSPFPQPILKNIQLALYHYIRLPQEQEDIMEHRFVSKEQCDSRIHWQVIHVHEIQNGAEGISRGTQAVTGQSRKHHQCSSWRFGLLNTTVWDEQWYFMWANLWPNFMSDFVKILLMPNRTAWTTAHR